DLSPMPGAEGLLAEILTFLQPIMDDFRLTVQSRANDFYIARITGDDASPERVGQAPYVTRLDVILKSDPFEPESAATLKLIQTWLNDVLPRHSLVGAMQTECFGITANGQDLAEVTEGDRHRVNALVLLAIFAILLVLVR